MKKTFSIFKNFLFYVLICIVLVLSSGCDNLHVEQIETITIEKQKNQRLFMLNNAQAQDLNILILPEAYTHEDMNDFVADACKLHSILKNTSPYSYLMDKLNIWYAAGYLSESGELGSKKTAFGSGKPSDRTITIDEDSVVNAVAEAKLNPANTIVVILVNTDAYIGYCTFYNGVRPTMAVCAARDNYYATTIIHELGHAIGLLADEYDDDKAATESDVNRLKIRHDEGYYLNVSSSAENVAWRMIIDDDAYAMEQTGVYVGAYYCSSGMFRSTKNSAMCSHWPNYNAISRLRIYQQIYKSHTGKEPSYELFRADDLLHPAIEWDWKTANQNRCTITRSLYDDSIGKNFSHSCILE